MSARFDFFTERARAVLTYAHEEAARFNHNYIGTEHLLLGLLREEEGVAAKMLSGQGVDLDKARKSIEFIIGRGEHPVAGELGLTPRAKRIPEMAVDEARRLGHHYVGTEHLLLGLLREGEGIACSVLETLGVNLKKLRNETLGAVGGAPPSQPLRSPVSLVTWEYLVAQTAQKDGVAIVHSVEGREDSRLPSEIPIHEALHALGAERWELVGIDRVEAEGPGALYIFKRPAR